MLEAGKGPEPRLQRPGQRWGWVFAGVWLLNLAYPMADLLGRTHPLWVQVAGTAGTVAFCVIYLWGLTGGMRSANGACQPAPVVRASPVALYAVAGAMTLAVGESAAGYFVFALAAAMLLWRPAVGVAVSAATVSWVGLVLPRLFGDRWSLELAIIAGVVTLMMLGVRRIQAAEASLRRTQEDLARLAVDAERARFSRELHDILGHSLTVIAVKSELARRLAGQAPERAAAEMGDVERLAREALTDVRATVAGYRGLSLAAELARARQALEAAGVTADLPATVDGVATHHRELFGWVLREGVTNVVRHSGARTCWVQLAPDALEVADDGRGPEGTDTEAPGHGLAGLRERVADAGGVLEVGRRPGGGFRLRVKVPAEATGEAAS